VPIFHPASNFILIWSIFYTFSLIYYFFVIPMIINFGKSISSPALFYVSLAVIIFDVFIRVNTSLYKKGNLVNKRLEII